MRSGGRGQNSADLTRGTCSPAEAPAHAPISDQVAPGNPNVGIMLPYTPLHHLLLQELDFPVVATSGNLTDEPICTDEEEARDRLVESLRHSWSTIDPSSATWTTAWPGSWRESCVSCAGRAATRHCR